MKSFKIVFFLLQMVFVQICFSQTKVEVDTVQTITIEEYRQQQEEYYREHLKVFDEGNYKGLGKNYWRNRSDSTYNSIINADSCTVFALFTTNKGKIYDIIIIKGNQKPELNEETVRIVKSMEKKSLSNSVQVRFLMPVFFNEVGCPEKKPDDN